MPELHREALLCEHESDGVSLTLYRRENFSGLQEPWRRIAAALSQKRFFHLYSWYRSYCDTLEENPDAVFFLIAARGPNPVAVFPLKRSVKNVCGLPLRCLEIPSHPHLSLSDFIFEKTADNAALVRLLVKKIRRLTGAGWDLIHLPNTLEDSAAGYALERAPAPLTVTTLIGKSNHVGCNLPYEQAEKNFKGHFRRNLRRWQRRAQESGKLQYQSYAAPEDIRRHFAEFLKVEASGWKGEQGTRSAISCDPKRVAFYEKLIDEFSPAGQFILNLLTLNEKCIAGQLCLLVDDTLYILKIGFDESFGEIAPGNLVMGGLIRQCADDDRIQTVSFVTDREWNYFWGATSTLVYTHAIFNHTTLLGWLGYLGCQTKKMIKRLLPPAIREKMMPWPKSGRESTTRSTTGQAEKDQ